MLTLYPAIFVHFFFFSIQHDPDNPRSKQHLNGTIADDIRRERLARAPHDAHTLSHCRREAQATSTPAEGAHGNGEKEKEPRTRAPVALYRKREGWAVLRTIPRARSLSLSFSRSCSFPLPSRGGGGASAASQSPVGVAS